ncbi:MAG: 50S ribosomal protein L22 [Abditibacteriales bacterium]|nr:50S ribosomal protein L22 [Abditibacteriales bacterium]MDW8364984.1 50S ribosomal protein L22 [Abditibacteriales bacterium]
MARAVLRHVRMSPFKVRRVANLVRGKSVDEAQRILAVSPQRASGVLAKVIKSAAANAETNEQLDRESLYITAIYVDEGPTWKRFLPRARGRADRILKRTSHITVVVDEREGSV